MAVTAVASNKWDLRGVEKITSQIIMSGLEDFMDDVESKIKANAPGSIGKHTKVRARLGSVQVINDHEAAAFVEFGTPAHKIEASPGGVLRWFDDAGEPIFAKSVNHPGTDPNPFMRNAIDDAIVNVKDSFRTTSRRR